jgi:hypothetical protein
MWRHGNASPRSPLEAEPLAELGLKAGGVLFFGGGRFRTGCIGEDAFRFHAAFGHELTEGTGQRRAGLQDTPKHLVPDLDHLAVGGRDDRGRTFFAGQ